MNTKKIIIGVSGVAGSGKDTFCNNLKKYFKAKNKQCSSLSFAEALKKQVKENSIDLYGVDPLNCSRTEKNTIRPFLVAHGQIMRNLSQGKHWLSILEKKIEVNKINVISDVRYNEYPEDEAVWIKKEKGCLIHLSRYDVINNRKVYIPPANNDEKKNDPLVKKISDFIIEWETGKVDQKKMEIIFKKIEKKLGI